MLTRLAAADAFGSLGLTRRKALWAVEGLGPTPLPLFAAADVRASGDAGRGSSEQGSEPAAELPVMPLGTEVISDYAALRLSLKRHPLALLRLRLAADGLVPNERLGAVPPGARVSVAGLVMCRQRPGTASGVIFITIEDETDIANLVVWPKLFERYRKEVLRSRLLAVTGKVEREGLVIHVIADKLIDLSGLIDELARGEIGPTVRPRPARIPRIIGFRHPRHYAKEITFPSHDFH